MTFLSFLFRHKKRTVQIVDDDCAVPIFADNFYNTFGEPIFDVNLSKCAAFYFYDLSLESRNRPHNFSLNSIRFAHFGKRKRRLRVESPFVVCSKVPYQSN